MIRSLAIIGAGRVGRALGRRLRELGWKITAVVTRSEPTARRAVLSIGAGKASAGLSRRVLESPIILIATPDHVITEIAQELARIGAEELKERVVLHTSGVLDASVLAPLREQGAATGSIHPLQTFTGVGIPPLEGKLFAIEGSIIAVRAARLIARSLGGAPIQIPSEQKALYHAAATMAAGHALTVVEAATRMLMYAGMKRREAVRALLPLTRQVLENFELLGPRLASTGPLSSGDYDVVTAHLTAMKILPPEFTQAYEALNQLWARALEQNSEETLEQREQISLHKKAKAQTIGG